MKYCAAFFVTLFTATPTFAYNLDCANSDGDLHLTIWSKSGGAAPYPGMLLSTTQWLYKNSVVFEENHYHSDHPKLSPESNITWMFKPEGRSYLERENTGYSTHAVYVNQITLKSSDGQNMTGMDVPTYTNWFLCQEDNQMYP